MNANVIAPLDHIKNVVEPAKASIFTALDNNVFLPINQVVDAVEKSISNLFSFRSEVDDVTVVAFKNPPIVTPDVELAPAFVPGIERSVE
jgi:hypothetical protein